MMRNGNLPENLDKKHISFFKPTKKLVANISQKNIRVRCFVPSEQVLRGKDVYSKWMKAIPNELDYYITIAGSSHYSFFFKEEHYKFLGKTTEPYFVRFSCEL